MSQAPFRSFNPLSVMIDKTGHGLQVFIDFLRDIGSTDQVVTLATLPKPVQAGRCYVKDATGGGAPCYSDGVNWRRTATGAIVS